MDKSPLKDVTTMSSSVKTPNYCGESEDLSNQSIFWIEGVSLCVVGIIGIFGNFVTFYVLSKVSSKYNIFNKLLMQLVLADSISISLMIIDFSIRKRFHLLTLENSLYATLWPKLIYPLIKISFTWVTCCTVTITIER